MAAPGRLGGKALTTELRKLAATQHGESAFSKLEALTEMIWRQALGWTEETKDEHGNRVTKIHPPVAWCQQFLFERLEGKAAVAAPENESGIKAADKVRQLAKDRINKMAHAKAGVAPSGPPKYKPKRPE